MAQQFSKTDQKRITFLSVFATLEGDYDSALQTVEQMEADGFFEGNSGSRSSGRSERSCGRGSSSRSSSRSSGGGGGMRDPDGPPTEKQVNAVLKFTDDYNDSELWDMSKKQVSELIDELGIFN